VIWLVTDVGAGETAVPRQLSGEDEKIFVNLMSKLIDQHQLETPDFIRRNMSACEAFGAFEMADFWQDALDAYHQAYAMAEAGLRGERHLKIVPTERD
jgi:hypothetical protein